MLLCRHDMSRPGLLNDGRCVGGSTPPTAPERQRRLPSARRWSLKLNQTVVGMETNKLGVVAVAVVRLAVDPALSITSRSFLAMELVVMERAGLTGDRGALGKDPLLPHPSLFTRLLPPHYTLHNPTPAALLHQCFSCTADRPQTDQGARRQATDGETAPGTTIGVDGQLRHHPPAIVPLCESQAPCPTRARLEARGSQAKPNRPVF